nr:uncharacterized protein LOC127346697 [Lolium perenne]
MPRTSCARHGHAQSTCRLAERSHPWPPLSTLSFTAVPETHQACARVLASAVAVDHLADIPHPCRQASTSPALTWPSPTSPASDLASPGRRLRSPALAYPLPTPESPRHCRPRGRPSVTLRAYKRRAHPPHLSTPLDSPPSSEPPRTLSTQHCSPPPSNCNIASRETPQINPTLQSTPGAPSTTVELAVVCNVDLHQRRHSPESLLAVDPLPPPCPCLPLDDDDDPPPSDLLLIQRFSALRTDSVRFRR